MYLRASPSLWQNIEQYIKFPFNFIFYFQTCLVSSNSFRIGGFFFWKGRVMRWGWWWGGGERDSQDLAHFHGANPSALPSMSVCRAQQDDHCPRSRRWIFVDHSVVFDPRLRVAIIPRRRPREFGGTGSSGRHAASYDRGKTGMQ